MATMCRVHVFNLLLPALLLQKNTNTKADVTFTLSWWLECLVTSEAQGQKKGLSTLECYVQQREEKHGSDDPRRKGHF